MTTSHDGKTKVVGSKKPQPRLIVKKGASPGKEFLITKDEISIGRSPECEVAINDTNMSRKHARIVFLAGIFFVYDNESLNGTFLNGKKVVEAQLSTGDIIKIGETEFEFEFTKIKKDASFPKFAADAAPEENDSPSLELDDRDLPGFKIDKEHNRGKFYTVSLVLIAVLFVGMIFIKKYKTAQLNRKKITRSAQASLSNARPTPKETPDIIREPVEESNTTKYFSQGLLAMTVGDYREALGLFKKTLKLDPTHESAPLKIEKCKKIINKLIRDYFNSGLREYEIRYYDRAIMEWNRVLTLTEGYNDEMYAKALDRINEAKIRLAKQKNRSEQ